MSPPRPAPAPRLQRRRRRHRGSALPTQMEWRNRSSPLKCWVRPTLQATKRCESERSRRSERGLPPQQMHQCLAQFGAEANHKPCGKRGADRARRVALGKFAQVRAEDFADNRSNPRLHSRAGTLLQGSKDQLSENYCNDTEENRRSRSGERRKRRRENGGEGKIIGRHEKTERRSQANHAGKDHRDKDYGARQKTAHGVHKAGPGETISRAGRRTTG